MGERSFRKRDASSFDLWKSLFADDCAIFFNSRADLKLGTSYLFDHLRRFGLMIHIDVDTTLSTTEVVYFSPPRVDYSNADTSCFDIRNADGSTVGFVDFTKEFKYLGSIIDSSLTSEADVDIRVKAATSAFDALKNVLTSLAVGLRVKSRTYNAIFLTFVSMVAKPGACEKISSTGCAPSTIAAYAQCAASQWPTR